MPVTWPGAGEMHLCPVATDQVAHIAESSRSLIKAVPLRGTAGPASAPGLALARSARRTPGRTPAGSSDQDRPDGTHAGTALCPQSPPQWRPSGGRRKRSATPTIDPAATHKGIGACEEDREVKSTYRLCVKTSARHRRNGLAQTSAPSSSRHCAVKSCTGESDVESSA